MGDEPERFRPNVKVEVEEEVDDILVDVYGYSRTVLDDPTVGFGKKVHWLVQESRKAAGSDNGTTSGT